MSVFTAEVQGFEEVKRFFEELNKELSAKETRGILDAAGKVIVNQARQEVPWNGQIGDFFKRDLAVYRDHASTAKFAEYVLVGPRFKSYAIHNQDQKVAVIAQHMAEGFGQQERETKSKGRRGKVAKKEINPVLDAYRRTDADQKLAIKKGVKKQAEKLVARFPYLVNYV